jgi:hypothetical protein
MWKWISAFIGLTAVFLLVQLPASWVVQQLPSFPVPVQFSHTQGSVWSGNSQVQSGLLSPQPAQLDWQWQASELFSAKATWKVTGKLDGAQIDLQASATTGGWSLLGNVINPNNNPVPNWAQLLPTGSQANQRLIQYQAGW